MIRRFVPLLLLLLTACGSTATPTPAPTLDPVLARGKRAFEMNCGACHSLAANTDLVGPSLAGIAARGATRVDGLDARAYLYTSIMRPGDYLEFFAEIELLGGLSACPGGDCSAEHSSDVSACHPLLVEVLKPADGALADWQPPAPNGYDRSHGL